MSGYRLDKYGVQAGLVSDWTSVSDVGRKINGREIQWSDYIVWEDVFVGAIGDFFSESGADHFRIIELETRGAIDRIAYTELGWQPDKSFPFTEGQKFDGKDVIKDLARVSRFCLREICWCKIESDDLIYVHFGYDYYVYVGGRGQFANAVSAASARNLQVKLMDSPYIE